MFLLFNMFLRIISWHFFLNHCFKTRLLIFFFMNLSTDGGHSHIYYMLQHIRYLELQNIWNEISFMLSNEELKRICHLNKRYNQNVQAWTWLFVQVSIASAVFLSSPATVQIALSKVFNGVYIFFYLNIFFCFTLYSSCSSVGRKNVET